MVVGEKDTIVYEEIFGNVTVDIVDTLQKNKEELAHWGWDVEINNGK